MTQRKKSLPKAKSSADVVHTPAPAQPKNLHPNKLSRLVSGTKLSILELHALWMLAKRGDLGAIGELDKLLIARPRTREVLEVFARGGKHRKGFGTAMRKPESFWSRTTAKWLSVSSGGLPTLGKRR